MARARLVTHLHGTELKMLDRVGRLEAVAVGLDTGLDRLADVVDSGEEPHGCRVPETDRELLRRTNLSRYRCRKDWAARLKRPPGTAGASSAFRPTTLPWPRVSWASRAT